MDKKGVWWNSFFYFMNLFSVETFIFFIISPFLVQRERSTSARQTSSSSRRMASCACPWAWRVTASLTAARTSSPTQTRPALRWRHQIITGVNIFPTFEIKIKFCVCQIFPRPVSLFIIDLFITLLLVFRSTGPPCCSASSPTSCWPSRCFSACPALPGSSSSGPSGQAKYFAGNSKENYNCT